MKVIGTIATLALVACTVSAFSMPTLMPHDVVCQPPSAEWVRVSAAPADHVVEATVALTLQNLEAFDDLLMSVAHPTSPRYGHHVSHAEANAFVAPAAESVRAAESWLQSAGVDLSAVRRSTHSGFLVFNATIAQMERLMGAPYARYASAATGRVVHRLEAGSSHAELPAGIDFVEPALEWPKPRTLRRREVTDGTLVVTPPYLLALYNVPTGTRSKAANNSQAVFSTIEQYWSPADLAEFQKLFANYSIGEKVAKQIGENKPTQPGDEASLDVQTLTSVGVGVPTWVIYESNVDTPFLSWLVMLNNMTDAPIVNSASYGSYENGMSATYMRRVDVEFAKLGSRGVSVLIAAGDSGAAGNCTGDVLSPDYPASSPYVTAISGSVGGTPGKQPTGETVDYIGGSGFSNYAPRPSYQDAAVKKYLNSTSVKFPPKADWNQAGRAYADLAAQSELYVIVLDLIPVPGIGGTSCATPATSGIVSLLNDVRLQAGKSPLGFLNPLLYYAGDNPDKYPGAFSDIVSGTDEGCDLFGFSATTGWDAASGWGSLNYEKLAQYVLTF